MLFLLLLLFFILLVTVKIGGYEQIINLTGESKTNYRIYCFSKSIPEKIFKKKYLDLYYKNENILDNLKLLDYEEKKCDWVYELKHLRFTKIQTNHERMSYWPKKNQWNICQDVVDDILKYFYLNSKLSETFFQINEIKIVDVFGTVYNRAFEKSCDSDNIPHFLDFLKQDNDYCLFIKIPRNKKLCELIKNLIKNKKVKMFICFHKEFEYIFKGMPYNKKINIKKLYSHITKQFKNVEMLGYYFYS